MLLNSKHFIEIQQLTSKCVCNCRVFWIHNKVHHTTKLECKQWRIIIPIEKENIRKKLKCFLEKEQDNYFACTEFLRLFHCWKRFENSFNVFFLLWKFITNIKHNRPQVLSISENIFVWVRATWVCSRNEWNWREATRSHGTDPISFQFFILPLN